VDLSRAGYTEQRGLAFQAALLDRLRNLPGVTSATLTSHLPMGDDGSGNTWGFSIPGYIPAKGEEMVVITDLEGPDFFHTMSIALRQGREFDTHDVAASSLVAMVNQTMAQRYWPKGNAIGSSVIVGKRSCRIVGIVGDDNYYDPTNKAPTPVLFVPMAQNYWGAIILALRSHTAASAVAFELRQAVAGLDAALPLAQVRTRQAVMGERYQMASIPAKLLVVYALSSVLVAMLGLYAVMAYSVIERHREFALRIALGSTRAAVFRLVLGGSAWTAMIGLVVGGAGSIAAVRMLRSLLFGVAPFDAMSYGAAALCLVLTVFLAGVAPAQRAATIEPMRALRTE
jgi:predicted permease